MDRIVAAALLLALAGCAASLPQQHHAATSACTPEEASYACQVERYNAVSAP